MKHGKCVFTSLKRMKKNTVFLQTKFEGFHKTNSSIRQLNGSVNNLHFEEISREKNKNSL